MTEVSKLKNIGPTTAEWLRAIGIQTRQDLEDLDSVNAFQTIRAHGFNTSLLLLYALEGALLDIHWNQLPVELKSRLKSAGK